MGMLRSVFATGEKRKRTVQATCPNLDPYPGDQEIALEITVVNITESIMEEIDEPP